MKNTFAFEHKDFKELIDWFWQEWSRKKHRVNKDGLCQCESESLIRHSNDPNKMRAFLMISVFIGFFIRTTAIMKTLEANLKSLNYTATQQLATTLPIGFVMELEGLKFQLIGQMLKK